MLTKIINWVKYKILLHMPLWICGSLALLAFFLPSSINSMVLVFLFGTYFVSRYLWRRHLKKQNRLANASSGIFSLVFWGVIGVFFFYVWITPDRPRLALYETSEALVYTIHDPTPTTKATNDSNGISIKNGAKKGLSKGFLSTVAESVRLSAFTCAFFKQENLAETCPSSDLRVELDNNLETVEILVAKEELDTCQHTACQIWLIQTTTQQMSKFHSTVNKNANSESEAAPSIAQGNLIEHWENTLSPLIIMNKPPTGWRSLKVTRGDGVVSIWQKAKP